MASIEGYVIEELIGVMLFSFALLVLAFLIKLIDYKLKDRKALYLYILFVLSSVAVYAVYQLNVRIGSIMFVNGLLTMAIVLWGMDAYFTWKKHGRTDK